MMVKGLGIRRVSRGVWKTPPGAAQFAAALALLVSAVGCRSDVNEPQEPARLQAGTASASSALPSAVGAMPQIHARSPQVSPFSVRERARVCQTMCEHTRALKCTAVAECEKTCDDLVSGDECQSALFAALDCMVREPREHWTCGEDGLAVIQSGYCEREQAAFVACLRESS
jgi:hypothetical protein